MSKSHSHSHSLSSDQDLSFAIRESLDRFLNLLSSVGTGEQGSVVEEHEEHRPLIIEGLPSHSPSHSPSHDTLFDVSHENMPSLSTSPMLRTSGEDEFDVQSWIADINKRAEKDAENVFKRGRRKEISAAERKLDWREASEFLKEFGCAEEPEREKKRGAKKGKSVDEADKDTMVTIDPKRRGQQQGSDKQPTKTDVLERLHGTDVPIDKSSVGLVGEENEKERVDTAKKIEWRHAYLEKRRRIKRRQRLEAVEHRKEERARKLEEVHKESERKRKEKEMIAIEVERLREIVRQERERAREMERHKAEIANQQAEKERLERELLEMKEEAFMQREREAKLRKQKEREMKLQLVMRSNLRKMRRYWNAWREVVTSEKEKLGGFEWKISWKTLSRFFGSWKEKWRTVVSRKEEEESKKVEELERRKEEKATKKFFDRTCGRAFAAWRKYATKEHAKREVEMEQITLKKKMELFLERVAQGQEPQFHNDDNDEEQKKRSRLKSQTSSDGESVRDRAMVGSMAGEEHVDADADADRASPHEASESESSVLDSSVITALNSSTRYPFHIPGTQRYGEGEKRKKLWKSPARPRIVLEMERRAREREERKRELDEKRREMEEREQEKRAMEEEERAREVLLEKQREIEERKQRRREELERKTELEERRLMWKTKVNRATEANKRRLCKFYGLFPWFKFISMCKSDTRVSDAWHSQHLSQKAWHTWRWVFVRSQSIKEGHYIMAVFFHIWKKHDKRMRATEETIAKHHQLVNMRLSFTYWKMRWKAKVREWQERIHNLLVVADSHRKSVVLKKCLKSWVHFVEAEKFERVKQEMRHRLMERLKE